MAWVQCESDSVAASEYLKVPSRWIARAARKGGGGSTYRGTPLRGEGDIHLVSLTPVNRKKMKTNKRKGRCSSRRLCWTVSPFAP